MKRHHSAVPGSEQRSESGSRHGVAAAALLAAGLSCAVFVTLYRAPMPVDAFAALAAQMVTARHGVPS